MTVVEYIVAGLFALGVVVALMVRFGWSIATQHRDHGVQASGSLPRRQIWSNRRPAAHAGPVNPEAIPGAPIAGQPSDISAGIPAEDE